LPDGRAWVVQETFPHTQAPRRGGDQIIYCLGRGTLGHQDRDGLDGKPITFAEWGYLGKGKSSGANTGLRLLPRTDRMWIRAAPPRGVTMSLRE
jgi:hypothetical protein